MRKLLETFAGLSFFGMIALVGLTGPNPPAAFAATDVNVLISSAMPSRVVVTTGTVIRIDNWNKGIQGTTSETLLGGRKSVCWQNLDSADNIFCDINTSVSTITANANVGWQYAPSDVGCIDATRGLRVDCIAIDAAGAAGVVISVKQLGVNP